MAVLKLAIVTSGALALVTSGAGCYSPDAPDCVLACAANTDCVSGQVCTSDQLCAAPGITSCAAVARSDAGAVTDSGSEDAGSGTSEVDLTVTNPGTVQASTGATCTNPDKPPFVCTFQAPRGLELTLTAVPPPAKTFKGWTGACMGPDPVCHITPTTPIIVVGAKFS